MIWPDELLDTVTRPDDKESLQHFDMKLAEFLEPEAEEPAEEPFRIDAMQLGMIGLAIGIAALLSYWFLSVSPLIAAGIWAIGMAMMLAAIRQSRQPYGFVLWIGAVPSFGMPTLGQALGMVPWLLMFSSIVSAVSLPLLWYYRHQFEVGN